MKKTALACLLLTASLSYAQNVPLLTGPTGSPADALEIRQVPSSGYIGIGADGLTLNCALGVSNAHYQGMLGGEPPEIISAIFNDIAGTSLPEPGKSFFSQLVGHGSAAYPDDLAVDFSVMGNGNVAVGSYDEDANLTVVTMNNYPTATMRIRNKPHEKSYLSAANSLEITRDGIHVSLPGGGPAPAYDVYHDLVVTSDGLIGMGRATPVAHLDILAAESDGAPLMQVRGYGASTSALYIADDGKVGIGTTTPSQALEVAGTTKTSDMQVTGNTITANLRMTSGATSGYVLQSDGSGNGSWISPSIFGGGVWGASGSDIYNLNTGYVGINTSTPSHELDVEGEADISYILHVGAASGIGLLHVDATSQTAYAYANLTQASNDNLKALAVQKVVGGVGGDRFVVYGDGHTVIGGLSSVPGVYDATSNPGGYMLYVRGGILTEKVKIALTAGGNWSDYVFDKDYKLPKLEEVQTYITRHHHLPGVPSAAEVEKDGIDQGSMDATLLKKIEELTLYMLELKKENQELKKLITKK